MSQEIIYTSAPKGLKPGSSGFCTVVSTAGMAVNLAERLESLSGYRHLLGPHEVGENPVNYSHLKISVGGQKFHVLSRIADAGLDYTKRTNKIAHHVAFENAEALEHIAGPAVLMQDASFFVSDWNGKVTTIAEKQREPLPEPPLEACHGWQKTAGDAGWAGELVQSTEDGRRPMSILFAPDVDVLELVYESLALLPPSKRWNVTFNTYFTKLPAGVDCLWRFIPDQTPEAAALRRDPHARVIDLCGTLPAAPESPWAASARSGKPSYQAEPIKSDTLKRRSRHAIDAATRQDSPVPAEEVYDLEEPQPKRRNPEYQAIRRRPSAGLPLPYMAGIVALLLCVVCGLLAIPLLSSGSDPNDLVDASTDNKNPSEGPDVSAEDSQIWEKVAEPTGLSDQEQAELRRSQEIQQRLNQQLANQENDIADQARIPSAEVGPSLGSDQDASQRATSIRSPFEQIESRENRLLLPMRQKEFRFETVARIFAADPSSFLMLLPGEGASSIQELKIESELSVDGKNFLLKRRGAGLWDTVGTFRLNGEELQFRWENWVSAIADTRVLCNVDGLEQEVQLTLPAESLEPLQLRFDSAQHIHSFPFSKSEFTHFEVSLHCDSVAGMEQEPTGAILKNESTRISIPIEVDGPANGMWIDIKILPDQADMTFTPKANMRLLGPDQEISDAVAKRLNGLDDIEFVEREIGVNARTLKALRDRCQEAMKKFSTLESRFESGLAQERSELKDKVDKAKEKLDKAQEIVQISSEDLESAKSMFAGGQQQERTGPFRRKLAAAIQQRDAAKKQLDVEVNKLKTPAIRRELLKELKRITRQTIKWCDHVDQIFERIHDEGRVHIRLHSDDRELLKTEGWDQRNSLGIFENTNPIRLELYAKKNIVHKHTWRPVGGAV